MMRKKKEGESYPNINVSVRLIWGDRDWARPSERQRDRSLLPSTEMVTVEDGGHFLPVDRPDAAIEQIKMPSR